MENIARKVVFAGVLGLTCLAAMPGHAQDKASSRARPWMASAEMGLYLRLDTGYSWSSETNIRDKNFPLDGAICGDAFCTIPGQLDDVDNSWILGAGIGYRFDHNFRADATIGYRGGYKIGGSDGVGDQFSGDVTSLALMLNGYYDFDFGARRGSWRPYIGAGIGWARNKVESMSVVGPATGNIVFTVPDGTKDGFAWALMAGVAFELSRPVMLDVGYRYLDMGKVETKPGAVTPAGTYSGASGRLKAHELTIGIRY